jgi:hypothetical protein
MSKLTFVLIQNTLAVVSIAGLYQLTHSNWSFLCLLLVHTVGTNKDKDDE